jgi:hypothetical protein
LYVPKFAVNFSILPTINDNTENNYLLASGRKSNFLNIYQQVPFCFTTVIILIIFGYKRTFSIFNFPAELLQTMWWNGSEVRGFRFSVSVSGLSALIEKLKEQSLWIMYAVHCALEFTITL